MHNLCGTVLGERYHVLELIGEGGMGHVFVAEHVTLKRRVAIKVLREELTVEPANVERFLQEARAASAIDHPNVVDVTDFGRTPEGVVYFVMEYLEGEELTAMMHRHGALAWPSTQAIMLQVVRGLDAAHAKGVVYRDLKPANVYLTRNPDGSLLVKLLDFGIAKHTGLSERPKTKPNSVFGTARYMSPEQAAGKDVDARSDIYATGVVLYEMLTGRAPFESDNYMEVVRCHVNDPIPRPKEVAPKALIPDFVEDLVMRALEKDPKDRYPNMAEFEAAILGASIEATMASTNLVPEEADPVDRTFIWDAERGRIAREAASARAQVPAPDNVDATIIRPQPQIPSQSSSSSRPGFAPVMPPAPSSAHAKKTLIASSSPLAARAQERPSVAFRSAPRRPLSSQDAGSSDAEPLPPPMQDESPVFGASTDPEPVAAPVVRAGDGAFFASTVSGGGGLGDGHQGSPVLPAGAAGPTGSPDAHQTLPPVNWASGVPVNPPTGSHTARSEQSPTEEFALRLPRHTTSRNITVIIIALVALVVVGLGVTAWAVFFTEDDAVVDDVYPTVVAGQPKPLALGQPAGTNAKAPLEPLQPDPAPPEPAPEQGASAKEDSPQTQPLPDEATEEAPRTKKPQRKRTPRRRARSASNSSGGGSVRSGFNRAKRSIAACGKSHGAIEGTAFKVTFDVAGGRATNVKVQSPHSATSLGRCVAKAVANKARFGTSDASGETQSVMF